MAHAFFRKGDNNMAQKIVDISKYINNDAPQMVLFGKTYTVKNDKKTVLALNDLQLKAEVNGENADEKIIELLVGKEEAKEILTWGFMRKGYTIEILEIIEIQTFLSKGKL